MARKKKSRQPPETAERAAVHGHPADSAPEAEEAARPKQPEAEPRGAIGLLRDWVDPLIFAYLLAMFLRTFCVELFKIPSGSMTPTLVGDEAAEVDYDGDGDEDLITAQRDPRLPGRTRYWVFLRESDGFSPGPALQVDNLPLEVALEFDRKRRVRYDRICVNKFAYWFRKPQRGDIVVFKVPPSEWKREKPVYVKRLVGLPGEVVEIRGDRLYVDGQPVASPPFFADRYYSNVCNNATFDRRVLEENEYLMFGDHTLSSSDSRYWGPVSLEHFKGKAFLRYWPLAKIRFLP